MIYFDVPASLWLVNLAMVCIGTCIALLLLKKPIRLKNSNPFVVLALCLILLLGTFFDHGIMDVHRWINYHALQINIGLLVSPLLWIQISRITNLTLAITFSIIISLIFLLQPDASLVSAFSISMYILLFRKCKTKFTNLLFLFFTLFVIGYSWYNLDTLEPVSYVENIIDLTKEIYIWLFFVSLITLLLLIIPFIYFYSVKKDILFISLGVYFLVLLLATFVGHFPVMLMGYGISPILGYFIGLFWLINTISNKRRKDKILEKSKDK